MIVDEGARQDQIQIIKRGSVILGSKDKGATGKLSVGDSFGETSLDGTKKARKTYVRAGDEGAILLTVSVKHLKTNESLNEWRAAIVASAEKEPKELKGFDAKKGGGGAKHLMVEEDAKQARRKAATEMVLADKGAEREAREKAAAEKAREKQRRKEQAAEEKAAVEKAQAEAEERARIAAEQARIDAEIAAKKEAEEKAALIAAEEEGARIAAEEEAARIAAAIAAAEEVERAKLANEPEWVRRLTSSSTCSDPRRQSMEQKLDRMASSDSGAILFSTAGPVRIKIAEWVEDMSDLPRVVAKTMLLLRRNHSLQSDVVGKLPVGCYAYELETREIQPGLVRTLVAASTASPLGWVTAKKGGAELLGPAPPSVRPSTSISFRRRQEQQMSFYTSLQTDYTVARPGGGAVYESE